MLRASLFGLSMASMTSVGTAHPAGAAHMHAMDVKPSPRVARRAALFDSYRLNTASSFTTLDVPLKGRDMGESARLNGENDVPLYVLAATSKLQETTANATYRLIDDHFIGSNGVGHVRFQQVLNGIDVDTAYFNVNVLEDGTVLSFGDSFDRIAASGKANSISSAMIKPLEALKSTVELLDLPIEVPDSAVAEEAGSSDGSVVIKNVSGVLSEPKVDLVYVKARDSIILSWRVTTDIGTNHLRSYVDAATGREVVGVVDLTSSATYQAYPIGIMNPDEGSRSTIVDPQNPSTSPFGWHSDGSQSWTTLRGNNVVINYGTGGGTLPSSPDLIFSYPYSPATVAWQTYASASATQAFYMANKLHDTLYALGFNEAAGNFQSNNNGKGGRAGDPLQITIQVSNGGALISTPADGGSPRMQMGIWNQSGGQPPRDSVFDVSIFTHEYMHAVTLRQVGGPSTSGCLGGLEGLSINEGYSDFVPTVFRVKSGDTRLTDYDVGDWAGGRKLAIRDHYISTNTQTTPLTYADLNTLLNSGGGFDIATVWASALYDVFWNLVEAHGLGDADTVSLDAGGVPLDGRFLALKLVLDSQKLMPCSAHHLQARDAVVEADRILTGGANRCAIWRGFATRGFGSNAVYGSGTRGRVNGFAVPSGC